MAYENLKAAIKQAIKQNGNQEITGSIMQSTLLSMVDNIPGVVQESGTAGDKVMSQKVVSDKLSDLSDCLSGISNIYFGKSIYGQSGKIQDSDNTFITDFIPVKPNTKYVWNFVKYIYFENKLAYYDKKYNLTGVSGMIEKNTKEIETHDDTFFIRATFPIDCINEVSIIEKESSKIIFSYKDNSFINDVYDNVLKNTNNLSRIIDPEHFELYNLRNNTRIASPFIKIKDRPFLLVGNLDSGNIGIQFIAQGGEMLSFNKYRVNLLTDNKNVYFNFYNSNNPEDIIDEEAVNKIKVVFFNNPNDIKALSTIEVSSENLILGKFIDKDNLENIVSTRAITGYINISDLPICAKGMPYKDNTAFVACYDKDKKYLGEIKYTKRCVFTDFEKLDKVNAIITREDVIENTAFIKLNFYNVSGIIAGYTTLNNSKKETTNNYIEDFVVPRKVFPLISGENYYLYRDNIIKKPLLKYLFSFVTKSNIPFENYSRLTKLSPTEAGEKKIEVGISDCSLQLARKESFKVNVIDRTLIRNKEISVLTVGDSFTYIGTWLKHEKEKIAELGGTINLVGTTFGENADKRCEGYGGATAKKYSNSFCTAYELVVDNSVKANTGARYRVVVDPTKGTTRDMEILGICYNETNKILRISQNGKGITRWNTMPSSGTITKVSGNGDASINYSSYSVSDWNPFWDIANKKISFRYYFNKYNLSADALFLQFMHNDVKVGDYPVGDEVPEDGIKNEETLISRLDDLSKIIDTWLEEYANKKIILSIQSLTTVSTYNNNLIAQYFKYIELLYDRYKNNEHIIIMPVYPFVDNINAYPTKIVKPCEYYKDTETRATDGHPYEAWEQYGHCTACALAELLSKI